MSRPSIFQINRINIRKNVILIVLGLLVNFCALSTSVTPFKKRYTRTQAQPVIPQPNITTFVPQIPPLQYPFFINEPQQRPNPFEVIFEWRQIDFEFPSLTQRKQAIVNGNFVPTNNLPLGVERWRDRLFVTTPRWKNGVPATLSVLPLPARDLSPPLRPYPSWDWHADAEAPVPDCTRLMSVYRLQIDECERLWVLDAGVVNATSRLNQVCPPKLVVFNLRNDRPIFSYELPPDQVKQDSLNTNFLVDIRNGRCDDAYAYIADAWRYGVTVFSLSRGRSWRTTNHFYYPNPTAADYTIAGVNFQWPDGVFGLSLSPLNELQDRLLFFHPMSSFAVSAIRILLIFNIVENRHIFLL